MQLKESLEKLDQHLEFSQTEKKSVYATIKDRCTKLVAHMTFNSGIRALTEDKRSDVEDNRYATVNEVKSGKVQWLAYFSCISRYRYFHT